MKPDSPKGVEAYPPLPDIPFRYLVPADATGVDYRDINMETWRRLTVNETLWDLDFAPPLPQPNPGSVSGVPFLVLGLLGLLALSGN